MVRGIDHVGIAAADLPRAVAFYERVLGFERLGPDDPDAGVETAEYFWMDVGGGQWANFTERPDAVPDLDGAADDPHLAFRVTTDEKRAIGRRLEERGVEVRETDTSLYFHDPAGNWVEVADWDGPEAYRDHL